MDLAFWEEDGTAGLHGLDLAVDQDATVAIQNVDDLFALRM